MNIKEKKNRQDSLGRFAIAVIAVHAVSIAAVVVLFGSLFEKKDLTVPEGVIVNLENAVSSEETVIKAVTELSRLAGKSGYELALDDIIKDHRENIAGIKKSLPLLQRANREDDSQAYRKMMIYIIIILVVQGTLLLLSVFRGFHYSTEPGKHIEQDFFDTTTEKASPPEPKNKEMNINKKKKAV